MFCFVFRGALTILEDLGSHTLLIAVSALKFPHRLPLLLFLSSLIPCASLSIHSALHIFIHISLFLSPSVLSPAVKKAFKTEMKHLSEPFNTSSVHSLSLWVMKTGSILTSTTHSLHQCLPTSLSVDKLDITAKQATSILQKQLSGAQRTWNNIQLSDIEHIL